jgi:nitrite reductase (NADH) large subunit
MMQYLIVGNSAAGLNGAEAIRSRDPAGRITIVSDEDHPAYSRCLIPYYMEGKISEEDMLYRPADYYETSHFEALLGKRVEAVELDRRTVRLNDGQEQSYDKLLIATGGSPKLPDIPGIDKDGVLSFRTTKDMKQIMHRAKAAEGALVLGGGCIGLMAACSLHAMGLKVTVAIRSPHMLSQVADAEAAAIFQRRFEANGISVHTATDIVRILGDKTVKGVTLDNGKEIACQLVIVGKGVAPNIDLVSNTDIRTHWGIVVDDELKTNHPDVYAAGDVAETRDVVTGEKTVNAIWPSAAEQGRIAGANMTGAHQKYPGSIRMNSAEFFNLPIISIGLVRPETPDYEIRSRSSEQRDVFKKVVLLDDVLVGLVMVGEIENAGVYKLLMQKKVNVAPVKDQLLNSNFGFASVIGLIAAEQDKFVEPEYAEALLCREM